MAERQTPTREEIIKQDPLHLESFNKKDDKHDRVVLAEVSRWEGKIAYVEPGSASFISILPTFQAELYDRFSPEEQLEFKTIILEEVSACLKDFLQRKHEREQQERDDKTPTL